MVVVDIKDNEGKEWHLYIDGYLKTNLDKHIIGHLTKTDDDCVFIIDGPERCLTGDTIIRTNRAVLGRKHTLKWMYNQFHGNPDKMPMFKQWNLEIPTFVRSYNGYSIHLHKINDVVYSGKQKVWRLELEDEKFIKCTANHKIMTNNGFVELQNLNKEKDLVMCDTPNSKEANKVKIDLHRDIQISLKFHPEYLKHKKRVKIQQLIYESNLNGLNFAEFLEILMMDSVKSDSLKYIDTTKFCVHHKDFNHYNNNLDNLELMNKEDHLKLHGQYQYANFNQGVPVFVKIKSIIEIGFEDTYDIICDKPNHNFSANEIIVHNSGKSSLGQQIAKYIDNSFNLSRVCMTPEEFRIAIETAERGQAIVYDEAYGGLASRRALSEVNHILTQMMMECGMKNLVLIIILPTYYMLDKYVALFRARGLFHVYRKGTQKGFFMYFNQERKRSLYLKNQKFMSYRGVRSNFRGRFTGKYMVDTVEYNKKKRKALEMKWIDKKESVLKDQRDKFIYMIWREWAKSRRDISALCHVYGIELTDRAISGIIEGLYPELEPYAVKKKQELLIELKKKEELKGKIMKHRQKMKVQLEKELVEEEKLTETGEKEEFLGGTSPFGRVSGNRIK